MMLSLALTTMMGSSDRYAVRPSGEILTLTPRLGIRSLRSGRPMPWHPKFTDLTCDDWQVLSGAQLRQFAASHGGGPEDEEDR